MKWNLCSRTCGCLIPIGMFHELCKVSCFFEDTSSGTLKCLIMIRNTYNFIFKFCREITKNYNSIHITCMDASKQHPYKWWPTHFCFKIIYTVIYVVSCYLCYNVATIITSWKSHQRKARIGRNFNCSSKQNT